MLYNRVKGCYDILPEADELWKMSHIWRDIEEKARSVAKKYGFKEAILPVFEHTEVFTRSSGEGSDIVSKEMYTFEDKGGRSISLRPELTAPLVRAYIENNLHDKACNRFYYFAPLWRYNRAQKGRYRQFYQFGIEAIGHNDPLIDVESIALLLEFYNSIGLTNTSLLINSIGDGESRKNFIKKFKDYLAPNLENLSEESRERYEINPLRILDSKDQRDREICANAPKIIDFLSSGSSSHFNIVCDELTNLNIKYTIDHTLVRGLDYYRDTVYEIVKLDDVRAQNSLGGGGRYDDLMKMMGGPDMPGVGFATGIERVIQSMTEQENFINTTPTIDFYLIPLSEKCKNICFKYMTIIRCNGFSSLLHYNNFNVKKGLQTAVKNNASYAIIIGDDQLQSNTLRIKNLKSHEERDESETILYKLELLL